MKPAKKTATNKKAADRPVPWYKNRKILGIIGLFVGAVCIFFSVQMWMDRDLDTSDQKICAAGGITNGLMFSVPIKIPDEYEGCIATDEYAQEAEALSKEARNDPSKISLPQMVSYCEKKSRNPFKKSAMRNMAQNMKLVKQYAKQKLERQMQTCKDCYTAVIPTSSVTLSDGTCYLENPKLGEYCKPIPNCTPGSYDFLR